MPELYSVDEVAAYEQCHNEDMDDDLPRDVGDPVCWLRFVCQKCGQMREDAALDHCPNCGAAVDENSRGIDPVAR